MWNKIKNNEDLKSFMDKIHGFHDSCLKEFKYTSGAYVNKDSLSMHPINDERALRVLIQLQLEDISAVELEFSGLSYLKIFPVDNNYTCEILDVTFILVDNLFFWCDTGGLSCKEIAEYEGISICAENVAWRIVNKYTGKETVYISR